MIDFKFNLDSQFYDDLHKRLELQRGKYNQGFSSRKRGFGLFGSLRELYGPETIPSITHLEELIETAFWTSLKREEGRELRFTLTYVPEPWKEFSLSFKEPVRFNVSNLRKLAPALTGLQAAVTLSKKGVLEICDVKDSIGEPVSIKVLDPGQLIISFVLSNVAAISGDEPVFIRDQLLTWSNELWSIFGSQDSAEKFFAFSDPKVRTVINIAREMRRVGHGGAILVVPKGANVDKSIDYVAYKIDSEAKIAREYLKYFLEARKKQDQDKTNKEIAGEVSRWEERLLVSVPKWIAQLTAVDGATLLSSDLNVLGFGVRLKAASDSSLSQLIRIDPLEHDNWLTRVNVKDSLWGTRHKSAARFVFDNHDSIAIVASQDGNVTAYAWSAPKESPSFAGVQAFERLELTLF